MRGVQESVREVEEVKEVNEVKEKALRGASVNGGWLEWYDQRGVPPCFCVRVAGKGVRGQRRADSRQPTTHRRHRTI
jgi:hypothetical protein